MDDMSPSDEIKFERDEVSRLRKEFSDFQTSKEEELNHLAKNFLLESEKSCKLQRQVDLLEEENGVLRGKLQEEEMKEKREERDCCVVERERNFHLRDQMLKLEEELALSHGKFIKVMDEKEKQEKENEKQNSKMTKMKKRMRTMDEEVKTLRLQMDEKEALVDTVYELDEQVEDWRKRFKDVEKELEGSHHQIFELKGELQNMRNINKTKEGQMSYEYKILKLKAERSGSGGVRLPPIERDEMQRPSNSKIPVRNTNKPRYPTPPTQDERDEMKRQSMSRIPVWQNNNTKFPTPPTHKKPPVGSVRRNRRLKNAETWFVDV